MKQKQALTLDENTDMVENTSNRDWFDEIQFFSTKTFTSILCEITQRRMDGAEIFPTLDHLFYALTLVSPDDVKVVILGQDPYPTRGHAMGLSFSVGPDVTPLPKSLKNIFKELEDDIGVTHENGDLTCWAEQGVLLLNTCLTVEEGKAGSHSNFGWNKLTNEIIEYLNKKRENIVFILWGNHAQHAGRWIDSEHHHTIRSPHPSPLSAYRGFFGSKPFSKTNKYLVDNNLTPINW